MAGLQRDRVTVAAYTYLGLWGWFLYSFGPTVPLLRDEQGTSRAVAGLHGTAMAVGAVLAGLGGVAVVRRIGRRRAIRTGLAVIGVGVVVLAAGPGTPWTVLGVLVAGTGGSLALNSINPALADHHRESSAAALSEGNAVAAGVGIVAPLAVGASVAAGLTWRGATLVTLPLVALAWTFLARAPRAAALDDRVAAPRSVRAAGRRGRARGERLPVAFWPAWATLVCLVAVEFCTTYWSADLMVQRTGMGHGAASASVAAVLVGMTVGRAAAPRLTPWWSVRTLLLLAVAVTAAGWLVTWLSTAPGAGIVGLAVTGLGLALHFPLALSRLMDASGGRPDTATALASTGVGLASGVAPFALGALADHLGTHRAFVVVPVLLAAAGLLVLAGPGARRTTEAEVSGRGR